MLRTDQTRRTPGGAVVAAMAQGESEVLVIVATSDSICVIQRPVAVPPECRTGEVAIGHVKEDIGFVPFNAALPQPRTGDDHFTAPFHDRGEPNREQIAVRANRDGQI